MPKFLDAPRWHEEGMSGNAMGAEAFAIPVFSLNTESAMEFLNQYPDNCDFIVSPSVEENQKTLYLDSMSSRYVTVYFENDDQPLMVQKRTRYYLESSINPMYRISYTFIGAYANVTESITTLNNSIECTILPGSTFSIYTNDNTNWRAIQSGVELNGNFVSVPSVTPSFYAPVESAAGYQSVLINGPSILDQTPRWLNAPSASGGIVAKKRSSIKWVSPHCDAGVNIGIPTDSDNATNTSWALYLRGWSTETSGRFNIIASNAQYVITAQMYSFEGFIWTDASGSMKCKGRYQTSSSSDWNEIVTDLSYAVGANNTVSFHSVAGVDNKVLVFYCRYFLSE